MSIDVRVKGIENVIELGLFLRKVVTKLGINLAQLVSE